MCIKITPINLKLTECKIKEHFKNTTQVDY